MAGPNFSVGGLASGLDTNSIVDKLVALESRPITVNNQRQAALNVQISSIGDIVSKIKSLASSASNLAKGVSTSSVASTPSGISAAAGTGAIPGRYAISVTSVATSAKARSDGFLTSSDTVAGGSISLSVKGTAYDIAITANSDLGSVVRQINQSTAPVKAAIISDGSRFYVSLTNRETGKPIGSAADGGLVVTSDTSGLNTHVTQNAANAVITVDDLTVESQVNEVSTAIPGVTMTVKSQQLVASDLVIGTDSATSTSNIQGFVDAYNSIIGILKNSLRPDPKTPPAAGTTLDGSTVLGLERQLHGLLSSLANPTGTYRTLSDIGIKLQNDGTLSLTKATFAAALAKDPGAVDAVFSSASSGLGTQVDTLSKTYTDSVNGLLVQRQTSLKRTIKDLQVSADRLQRSVDSFKENLLNRFSNMEKLISNYNSIGTYLSNTAAAAAANNR